MNDMIERTAKAVYPLVNVDWDDARTISRVALLTALDPEDEDLMLSIKDRIKTHYWNHHGARDPSPEFVDDLAGMLVIGLQQMAQGERDAV